MATLNSHLTSDQHQCSDTMLEYCHCSLDYCHSKVCGPWTRDNICSHLIGMPTLHNVSFLKNYSWLLLSSCALPRFLWCTQDTSTVFKVWMRKMYMAIIWHDSYSWAGQTESSSWRIFANIHQKRSYNYSPEHLYPTHRSTLQLNCETPSQ